MLYVENIQCFCCCCFVSHSLVCMFIISEILSGSNDFSSSRAKSNWKHDFQNRMSQTPSFCISYASFRPESPRISSVKQFEFTPVETDSLMFTYLTRFNPGSSWLCLKPIKWSIYNTIMLSTYDSTATNTRTSHNYLFIFSCPNYIFVTALCNIIITYYARMIYISLVN